MLQKIQNKTGNKIIVFCSIYCCTRFLISNYSQIIYKWSKKKIGGRLNFKFNHFKFFKGCLLEIFVQSALEYFVPNNSGTSLTTFGWWNGINHSNGVNSMEIVHINLGKTFY